eukprot:TRINITY_DN40701_c0_g1_i1.p1 TRINITY_DN40701_c0_g1~~TRINITY_DN40701_c0_g1_i1.p1  ORF type:complete len:164 (-),score=13.90 TRINITY_DN40701_c0_g1_i1:80-571(-)
MKISSDRNLFPDTDGPAILQVLQSRFRIPGSSIKECKGQELAIALPRENTAQFPDLIKYVETDPTLQQQYGIQGISMSVATLEDVFLAIAHEEELKAAEQKNDAKKKSNDGTGGHAAVDAVSYTHLTLPTKRIGEISGGAGLFKKKKSKDHVSMRYCMKIREA